jgi:hypothetical protein
MTPRPPPERRRRPARTVSSASLLAASALLAACASAPPTPDWQLNAHAALDQFMAAYLSGDSRAAQQDFDRASREIARTGRVDLLARAELLRCAAQVASLAFAPCEGFDRLRPDTAAPEQAYARYLGGTLPPDQVGLLPAAQRAVAALPGAAGAAAAAAALQQIDDPVSRLVAAGVLMQTGRAGPPVIALAVDTASAQGWRRPLLAWLGVQVQRAELAGDSDSAERLRRRIGRIQTP